MSLSPPLSKGILLLSSGSKVAIARIAKAAARKRGLTLHGSDAHENVPTRHCVDQFTVFDHPREDKNWINAILAYCRQHQIGLVIPTRHQELATLASAASSFRNAGIALSLSGPETISLCTNKLDTYEFLRSRNAPTPTTVAKTKLAASTLAGRFPLFAKPSGGAASQGAKTVQCMEDLETIPEDWILQSLSTGQEYTVNLYLNRHGKVLCAIPHARIMVEAGEVVQAKTKRLDSLIAECKRLSESLPDAQGIFNIQAFHQAANDTFEIIEINPRIGGGYPLADQAKGAYLEWLCQEWIDGKAPAAFDDWTENLRMLRFRDAIFEN